MLIESEETKEMVLQMLLASIRQDKTRLFMKYVPVGKIVVTPSM